MEKKESMMNELKEAVEEGAKIGVSKKASDTLTKSVKGLLGKQYPSFFSTPVGMLVEPLVVPACVLMLTEYLSGTKDKRISKLQEVARLAVIGESATTTESLMTMLDPFLDRLLKKLGMKDTEGSKM